MTHFITTRFAPVSGCDVRAYLGGTNADIPVVDMAFDGSWHDSPAIQIQVGNHDEPELWLRDTAAALINLADQLEQLAATEKGAEA